MAQTCCNMEPQDWYFLRMKPSKLRVDTLQQTNTDMNIQHIIS